MSDQIQQIARRPFQPPIWGNWPIPMNVTLAYGARAMYQLREVKIQKGLSWSIEWRAQIDIDTTKQDMTGGSVIDRKEFCRWLAKEGLPALREKCVVEVVTPDSMATITFASNGHAIIAGPRGSYGYIHISAWKVP